VIDADVVYPAILLAHGKSISLFLAMVASIQSGLQVLTKNLCQVEAVVDSQDRQMVDSEGRPEVKTPNLRVKLPYTYPMSWYIMHCPSLMTAALRRLRPFCAEAGEFELVTVLYVLCSKMSNSNYQLDRCFPKISGASYGDKFADFAGPDDFTRLSSRVFWWLISIRPDI